MVMFWNDVIGIIMPASTYVSIIIYILATPTHATNLAQDETVAPLDNNGYVVLMDAGSSSTKLNVYRWYLASGMLLPRIELLLNVKFETPLSAFETDVNELKTYITDILTKAKQIVPVSNHRETPIYLMATAGLRFLAAQSVKSFLINIRSLMANNSLNPFKYSTSSVSMLSGEREGAYSWIAANYLLGFFDSTRPNNESVGILEMGGGSTQITFIPSDPLFGEEYQVIVGGRRYQLYVQSYLQYGANAIKMKIAHVLSLKNLNSTEVDNPCMLRGDTATSAKLDDGRILTQKGSGAPEACLKILQDILKPKTGINCEPKPCAIGSVYQPRVENIKFYATGAFTFAPSALKVIGKDRILNIDDLQTAAFKHCNRSIQLNEKYASDNCLMGLYIPSLLTVSYGFSRNTTNIKVSSTLGQDRIDWALGAVLVELSQLYGPRMAMICNPVISKTADIDSSLSNRGASQTVHSWILEFLLLLVLCNWFL